MDNVIAATEAWRTFVGVAGLILSAWSIAVDVTDRRNVRKIGSKNGPRYIQAMGHFYANATLFVAWLTYLYVASVTLYLPSRTDTSSGLLVSIQIGTSIYAMAFLFSQIHHAVVQFKLSRLTRAEWIAWIRELLRQLPEGRAS